MTSKAKLRIIALGWLIVLLAIVVAVARNCGRAQVVNGTPLSAGLRDSLLEVDMDDCRRVAYAGFTVWFDSARHIPACVTYELELHHLTGDNPRTDNFVADKAVGGCPLATSYSGSGFHRGHMAPAGDMTWSDVAIEQSFFMTNICPQDRSLNEGGWARLEEKCREWARRDSVLIIATGPVREASMDTIEGSGVAIPKRFFKVILAPCSSVRRAIAFVYPNEACNDRLSRYAVSVDDVEALTGIDFFSVLPIDEQNRIESARNLQVWLH